MMYKDNAENELLEIAKPQRLNPASIYFNLVRIIKETILGLSAGLIITIKQSMFYFLIFVGVFLLFLIISSILSWIRFTYRVENDELRIEQGVFVRKKRYVPINRIHKIDFTANVVHRIFGLVKIQIDTASTSGDEVSLSAVTVEKGEQLKEALKKRAADSGNLVDESDVQVSVRIEKITWKRLFITGTTSGGAGLILAFILLIFSQASDIIPENIYESTFEWIISLSVFFIVGLAITGLLLLWFLGIAGTMIRYGNFQISQLENGLFIKRGLLETKELTIPYDRIQAIGIEQSVLRQPLKYVSIVAVVAGGSADKLETYPVLFPLMREKEVDQFLQKFLPEYGPVETNLKPLAKQGLKYYLFQTTFIFIIATAVTFYFFPTYSWIPLIFVFLSGWFGWLRHKDGGYLIKGKQLTLRKRFLNKSTMIIYHKRIQSFEVYQHKLQQMQNISSIQTPLLGALLGKYKHFHDDDTNKMAEWFSYRKDVKYHKENDVIDEDMKEVITIEK